MSISLNPSRPLRTGWLSRLARLTSGVLVFETLTGLAITFAPFHATVEWGLLLHTFIGILTLVPVCWYCAEHWLDYREQDRLWAPIGSPRAAWLKAMCACG